jgi:hypothetical protein
MQHAIITIGVYSKSIFEYMHNPLTPSSVK